MWCPKPTFFENFLKSAKVAHLRILHSLKRSGVRLRTNLVVLGARDQDSGGCGGRTIKNHDISGQNDPSEGFLPQKIGKRRRNMYHFVSKVMFSVIFAGFSRSRHQYGERRYVYTEKICFGRRWRNP